MNWTAIWAVGGGAAAGAWARWGLSLALNPLFPSLPLGTLTANLVGGYLMGIMLGVITHFETLPIEARLLLTTGFLGGLTTFSTFSGETVALLIRQQYGWACAMIALHVAGSLAMTMLGLATLSWLKA